MTPASEAGGREALARALAELRREDFAAGEWAHDAMRITLLDIQLAIQPFTMTAFIAPLLGDSWAGRTLGAMLEHHEGRVTERRWQQAYESPEAAQKRRDEKKRLKAEAHATRLEAKKERDRLWRERIKP